LSASEVSNYCTWWLLLVRVTPVAYKCSILPLVNSFTTIFPFQVVHFTPLKRPGLGTARCRLIRPCLRISSRPKSLSLKHLKGCTGNSTGTRFATVHATSSHTMQNSGLAGFSSAHSLCLAPLSGPLMPGTLARTEYHGGFFKFFSVTMRGWRPKGWNEADWPLGCRRLSFGRNIEVCAKLAEAFFRDLLCY
jgi:hypothetical protein